MGTCVKAGGVQLPLGYIFEFDPTGITNAPDLSTADKVHDYFGYGTWEDYGAGRVTIGVSNGHEIGSEGGEESHTIIASELPERVVFSLQNTSGKTVSTSGITWSGAISTAKNSYFATSNHDAIISGINSDYKLENQPHNNMQPYRTVYRWRRIA